MRTAPEMIRAANAQKTNRPGFCQRNTWMLYEARPAGDVDNDDDADARDGWLSEPKAKRHTDRKPMIGSPGYWSGGSGGFGHRANCVGYDSSGEALFRSTDAGGRGKMATKTLSWFEREWHLRWEGWSETITGLPIEGLKPAPGAPQPKPKPKSRGAKIDQALALTKQAKARKGTVRAERIDKAVVALAAVPFIK